MTLVFSPTFLERNVTQTVFPFKLLTNGRNNYQHYWANNVGCCCVRVGSGVQTDATYPNNVGACIASWEGYSPSDVGNLL